MTSNSDEQTERLKTLLWLIHTAKSEEHAEIRIDNALERIEQYANKAQLLAAKNEALIADKNLGKYPDYNAMKIASLKRIDDLEKGIYLPPAELSNTEEKKQ